MGAMVRLKSDCGNYYEFDPNSPMGIAGGYWSCYIGNRISGMVSVQVKIYSILTGSVISERFIMWLKNIPESIFNHFNIISPIDYVEELEVSSTITNKHLYVIENVYNSVSLSDLMQGQIHGAFGYVDYAAEMYKLYLNNRSYFSRIVAIELLKVLGQLHEKGIIIGCIDSDFILFTDDNRIKIDFIETFHWYLVKQATYSKKNIPQSKMISLWGVVNGKYRDMVAPELLYGYTTDARIDLYSTGILLFFIVTGHLPHYRNDDMIVPLNQEMPLHEIKDRPLRRIVEKATEKNPAKRYQTAREFIVALSNIEKVQIPWYRKIFIYFHKNNCLLCIILSILFTFLGINSNSPNSVSLNYKDGSVYNAPIEHINNIT